MRVTHRQVSLEALGRMMDPPTAKDAVAGRIRSGLTRSRGHRAPAVSARMFLSCGVTQVLLVVIGLLLIGLPLPWS